ncbi:hypothetical protein FSARC_8250 [Fusarium sarcochroum]|uniref:Infection structure specific protein n=1 Tax=Fusarium sarcochroum TaxID=1208366 RepID=A0A8H4X6H2_9HYPO|nr:hypothetical protein FSARC_8250 [Fusarium sarcochroum]
MQTKYLPILAAAAATTVSAAEVQHVDVVHIFDTLHVGKHIPSFTPNKRDVNAIFARADKDQAECQSSLLSIIKDAPTPTNRAVQSYFLTAQVTEVCTLTAPASISSDIMSYVTEIIEWVSENEKEIVKLGEECLDEDDVKQASEDASASACPTPGRILFTASNGTKTVELDTAFPTPAATGGSGSGSGSSSDDPDTKDENAAASRGASMVAAIAAVGIAGFMIAA